MGGEPADVDHRLAELREVAGVVGTGSAGYLDRLIGSTGGEKVFEPQKLGIVDIADGGGRTADKLGLKPGQFNAIKYNCGKYNNSQLVKSLEFLSGIDKRIKTGELPTNILRDYIVLSLLSF